MGLLDLLKNFKKTGVDVAKILILGLDNAGKTTILQSLSQEEMQITEPTKGFNVKTVINKDFRLNVWDLGGQQEIRKYWQHFYKDCHGIVYVIDSSDDKRMVETNDQLQLLLDSSELKNVPILVLANKQDLDGLPADDIIHLLKLDSINNRNWSLFACSALKGEGIKDGITWLLETINVANSEDI